MRLVRRAALAATTLAFAGCGGGTDSVSGDVQGTLNLRLIDAPVDDAAEVWVRINGASVRDADADERVNFPFSAPLDVDLLTLVDGNAAVLLSDAVLPAGTYDQLRLDISAEFDGVIDSYVITDTGEQFEIRVPSGSQTGLKLNRDIVITDNTDVSFLLDWDVRQGLVNPPGQPGYLLKPVIRVIDDTESGTLTGTVATALVEDDSCTNDLVEDTGNAVYIFDGLDAAPTDIAGLATDPAATVAVRQREDGSYGYSAVLTPGDYTVAFTCQASSDDPEIDESTFVPEGETDPMPIVFVTNFSSNVNIFANESEVVDF